MSKTTLVLSFVLGFMQAAIAWAGNDMSAKDRLKSCNSAISIAAAEEIVRKPETLNEPMEFIIPAAVLFQWGKKDEGVFWYYVAHLRTHYQFAFENGARGPLLENMQTAYGSPIVKYAFKNPLIFDSILGDVLAWDKATFNPFRELPQPEAVKNRIEKLYGGVMGLRERLQSKRSEIEAKVPETAPVTEAASGQQANPKCPMEFPPPTISKQDIADWSAVKDFVKANPDVLREVESVKYVVADSDYTVPGESRPSRYVAAILVGRPTYAVVDVSRSTGEMKLTLACITHLTRESRRGLKDVCKQSIEKPNPAVHTDAAR
jgi:hypothetical protein